MDIVKELTLRMRGQREVEKLLKGKRVRKVKTSAKSQEPIETSSSEEEEMENSDEEMEESNELDRRANESLENTWHETDDSADSDTGSCISNASISKAASSYQTKSTGLAMIIEDSDGFDADIID